ncbi:MAG: hypothetical protein AAF763_11245, partial [Pseudomonadota bacterium]
GRVPGGRRVRRRTDADGCEPDRCEEVFRTSASAPAETEEPLGTVAEALDPFESWAERGRDAVAASAEDPTQDACLREARSGDVLGRLGVVGNQSHAAGEAVISL